MKPIERALWLDVISDVAIGLDTLDASVPSPQAVLGRVLGVGATSGEQIERYSEVLADASDRIALLDYGRTRQGRRLRVAVAARPDRLARLHEIWDQVAALGNGRAAADGARLHETDSDLPVTVWVGCGIHGDEPSGGDAALAVLYRLAAGTDQQTLGLLDRLIVVIDANVNPDGRHRYLTTSALFAADNPSLDPDDQATTGCWPTGRGNHYLVDLNRDLILQTQLETVARTRLQLRCLPQLVLELHEMGPDDTFLFASPAEPINPFVPEHVRRWWQRFADGHGAALDQLGASWYRGEWNEVFYPGYQDIWPAFGGGVPIIFEQARRGTGAIERADGTRASFAEAVGMHAASVFANLQVAAEASAELLEGWATSRREACSRPGAFLLGGDDRNPQALDRLVAALVRQGVEVLRDPDGVQAAVPVGQPLGRLAEVLLGVVDLPADYLAEERQRVVAALPSRLFDVTAWHLPSLFGVAVEMTDRVDILAWRRWSVDADPAPPPATAEPADIDSTVGRYGVLLDDRHLELAGRLMARKVRVRIGLDDVSVGSSEFCAGSLLVRRSEFASSHGDMESDPQPDEIVDEMIRRTAFRQALPLDSSGSSAGPDFGGQRFARLRLPKLALVGGEGVFEPSFGAARHHIDVVLGIGASVVHPVRLHEAHRGNPDVIVLCETDAVGGWCSLLGRGGVSWLAGWVRAGGTLVAVGSAANLVTDAEADLSTVRPVESARSELLPSGALLGVMLERRHPLAAGLDGSQVVIGTPAAAFDAGQRASVFGRFAPADSLVAGGLVRPDAANLLAGCAWGWSESVGRGAVVAFATDPTWRCVPTPISTVFSRALLLPPVPVAAA